MGMMVLLEYLCLRLQEHMQRVMLPGEEKVCLDLSVLSIADAIKTEITTQALNNKKPKMNMLFAM
jgi:uncharacterized lipoprotein YbaY